MINVNITNMQQARKTYTSNTVATLKYVNYICLFLTRHIYQKIP
ncbi:hypothetical protein M917_2235 [Psychrobacter aquaticus CMS 56]|uniref:Uncharacterized protein n=1 Tax=Psychrobacter aquaticus CMS 56 TaxID=1354303 RepID=U4T819_9GAMM|nr:hypothetical protein M917_2235 [Psychrobacter aquaticus CMS 56]